MRWSRVPLTFQHTNFPVCAAVVIAAQALLLKDAPAACVELGLASTTSTLATVLVAVANEPGVHNVVVCTLCSCWPLQLLGRPPSWYKSRSYRSRTVREPRKVLSEFGLKLPSSTSIRVHDSTADCRYLVVPVRPEGTDGWSEDELAQCVTRDSMVGVSLAMMPKGKKRALDEGASPAAEE